ncbi:hypothetical protein BJ508DRAFT_415781 [Ascobolus immersus RN42]|uniref:B30.2/SPRY domain-containing protein n=1 Tax=Ascobolus immersus RN42 TaxID=1160509 RepID=A0A3N4I638_ASCIM|nr:hypothetical protein BJ508DRAFT_415781 [Ascobolus immersus RN42]
MASPSPSLKRPFPEDPVDAPSPSNKSSTKSKPVRDKKETWKKKDGGPAGSHSGTPAPTLPSAPEQPKKLGLLRWKLPAPVPEDFAPAKPPIFTHHCSFDGIELCSTSEHPKNRRGFRYIPCRPSRMMPHLAYQQTEAPPFCARINWEDTSAHVFSDPEGRTVMTDKGYRMARANVGVREGKWYFECKILSGYNKGGTGNVRVGWARREAPLDAPVGFDGYSYGIRDIEGQKMHLSRPKPFMNESVETGDILGLEIYLPSLATQVALDTPPPTAEEPPTSSNLDPSIDPSLTTTITPPPPKQIDVIRDRVPIRYKNRLYFEQYEYAPTKEMEDLMNPSPNASKPSTPPQTLPGSYIKIYKNGVCKGTPFEDLLSLLPPKHSKPSVQGSRETDDGTCGYYPAISLFGGGKASLNFGPDFDFPPPDLVIGRGGLEDLRPVCERYDEQICEDLTYDLLDEIDLWCGSSGGYLDSGVLSGRGGTTGGGAGQAQATNHAQVGDNGGIKEMEIDEE